MELIDKYFPDIETEQRNRFVLMDSLYREWNEKINVISRKDIDCLYEHHVLHSLSIAKLISFHPGTKILDVGTGGGFPGIPLAIMFPECEFLLVDSIGKKIQVVRNIALALKLHNVRVEQVRAEEVKEQFDFVVSRAVTSFPIFVNWIRKNILNMGHNKLHNGVLYLKGGDVVEELLPFKNKVRIYELSDFFLEEFFETKKIIHLAI